MKNIYIPEVSSTMTVMEGLADEGALPEGSVVWTDHQTLGVGQDGHPWLSERSRNLLFTTVLYPRFLPAEEQFLLSKVVSLAICDTLSVMLPGASVSIKWPNDIYLGHGKLAGILIRHRVRGQVLDRTLVGIGMNVNQLHFPGSLENPVSLIQYDGLERDRQGIMERLMESLMVRYGQLRLADPGQIDREYDDLMYLRGMTCSFSIRGQTVMARIAGVDAFGRLLLESEGDSYCCDLKEVSYLIRPGQP